MSIENIDFFGKQVYNIIEGSVIEMKIQKEILDKILQNWEQNLRGYSLPMWEQLPTIDLYMEQVTALISQYLGIYSEKPVTPSMINNYVKLKIITAPQKKKYSRKHIAYLIIVCTLKQTLDMATIQKLIPADLDEEQVTETYNSFARNQKKAFLYATEKVSEVSKPLIENEGDNENRLNDLIMQISASANTFKMLAEKIAKASE